MPGEVRRPLPAHAFLLVSLPIAEPEAACPVIMSHGFHRRRLAEQPETQWSFPRAAVQSSCTLPSGRRRGESRAPMGPCRRLHLGRGAVPPVGAALPGGEHVLERACVHVWNSVLLFGRTTHCEQESQKVFPLVEPVPVDRVPVNLDLPLLAPVTQCSFRNAQQGGGFLDPQVLSEVLFHVRRIKQYQTTLNSVMP
jgi:hypothetical protein